MSEEYRYYKVVLKVRISKDYEDTAIELINHFATPAHFDLPNGVGTVLDLSAIEVDKSELI